MNTVALNGRDIDRVVIWAGATLQAPHRAMAAQRGIAAVRRIRLVLLLRIPGDALRTVCRPAHHRGGRAADARISDAFIKAVRGKPDRASLRLKTISWNGQTDVITLKLDKHYWPAYELDRQRDGSWTTYRARSPDLARWRKRLERTGSRYRAPPVRSFREILAIYNEVIRNTTAVYSDAEVTLANREAWFDAKAEQGFPVLVAMRCIGCPGIRHLRRISRMALLSLQRRAQRPCARGQPRPRHRPGARARASGSAPQACKSTA